MSTPKPSQVKLDQNSKTILSAFLLLIITAIVFTINTFLPDSVEQDSESEINQDSPQEVFEPIVADTSSEEYDYWLKEESVLFDLNFLRPENFVVTKDDNPKRIIIKPRDQREVLRIEVAEKPVHMEFYRTGTLEQQGDSIIKIGSKEFASETYKLETSSVIEGKIQTKRIVSQLVQIRPDTYIRIDEVEIETQNSDGIIIEDLFQSEETETSKELLLNSFSFN